MTLSAYTPAQLALRRLKVGFLGARRLLAGAASHRPQRSDPPDFGDLVYHRRYPLSSGGSLDGGKHTNLALAASHLHGLVIGPQTPFSFWAAVGRTSAARGYVLGAQVRAGCVVPTMGGGICLLTNALFQMALSLGWHIDEAHAHTLRWVGRHAQPDATVCWPHVDLRFRPRFSPQSCQTVCLSVVVSAGVLHVKAFSPVSAAYRGECEFWEYVAGKTFSALHAGVGDVLCGVLRRRVYDLQEDAAGELVNRRVVFAYRARVVVGPDRNCFTCGETKCAARPQQVSSRSGVSHVSHRDRLSLALI